MAFQRAAFCASAEILYTYSTKVVQNTLNFQYQLGLYDQAKLNTLSDQVDQIVHSNFKSLISLGMTYLRTEVRGLNDENDLTSVNADNTGLCTAAGTQLPLNVTFCLKLGTGFTGKSARGRFYTVGMQDGHLNSGNKLTVTTTYRDAWVAALNAMKSACALLSWNLVIVSRWHNNVKREEALVKNVTTISYANIDVDSQRGRLL